MDVEGTVVWGFAGTAILTMILRISQAIGLTRMDLPLMIGLFVTPSRDRAKAYGLGLHMISGWIAALMYGVLFENMGWANWRTGALIGVVHALIQQTRKYGVAIKRRKAPPVDGARPRDQGDASTIADHTVVRDRGILLLSDSDRHVPGNWTGRVGAAREDVTHHAARGVSA